MNKSIFYIIPLIFTLFSSHAAAETDMVVETFNNPSIARTLGDVKVLRDSKFIRATYGMMLNKGDKIYTGRRGRAYIDFPDNSRVKLGSRTRFLVKDWGEKEGVYSSALSIFQGAFRYTAGIIRGFASRSTTVTTRTAVIGVRGTDFWGRVGEDETFFLLIEGEVSLTPTNGESTIYNKALHAVNIDKSSVSNAEALEMAKIAPLAAETEIDY